MPARDLWRKMLSMLFETGHPWITFKDACNVRSPQQHVGVVHSSNLCTEITLNTSETEIAVCNLGSVNLVASPASTAAIDQAKLKRTVATAMRMLDNVIDINYYAVKKARDSNLRHRPVGPRHHGLPGRAVRTARAVCVATRRSSSPTARWKRSATTPTGRRPSWPRSAAATRATAARCGTAASCRIDSLDLLSESRGGHVEVDRSSSLDWDALRQRIAAHGMRNSNCVAIAPTATISNIIGVSASIEPSFGNLSVKSNLSGEFTLLNEYLVRDLKSLGLWDDVMVMDLKHFDGSLRRIDRVPEDLKDLYATAFEIETAVAGRGRGAAPEVDRPGAVAQHLHGRRVGQEARRDLQAGVAARPEDDLLPAHGRRDACREVDRQERAHERGVEPDVATACAAIAEPKRSQTPADRRRPAPT